MHPQPHPPPPPPRTHTQLHLNWFWDPYCTYTHKETLGAHVNTGNNVNLIYTEGIDRHPIKCKEFVVTLFISHLAVHQLHTWAVHKLCRLFAVGGGCRWDTGGVLNRVVAALTTGVTRGRRGALANRVDWVMEVVVRLRGLTDRGMVW